MLLGNKRKGVILIYVPQGYVAVGGIVFNKHSVSVSTLFEEHKHEQELENTNTG